MTSLVQQTVQQASSTVSRNTFGKGATLNVKVTNGRRVRKPSSGVSIAIDAINLDEMPPPPPPSPTVDETRLETLETELAQAHERLTTLKASSRAFLERIGWTTRAIERFVDEVWQ